jgi:myo-inositol 2-dehydrogenase/D-chiro-inositol 1-dehydrogenase
VAAAEATGTSREVLRAIRAIAPVDYRNREEVVRSLRPEPVPGRSAEQARDDSKPGIAEPSRDAQQDRITGARRPNVQRRSGVRRRHPSTTPRSAAVTVRVGVVGAGGVGARHARTLAGFPDVELVAVCDSLPGAAEAVARPLGVAALGDLDSLLARRLDGIWLCVPPFAHGELERSVLRAGVPFFVEKPLAADLAVAEDVAAAVAAAGLPTATGYHWRHLDTVARARDALYGATVRLVDARWWGACPPPAWWRRQDRSGGQVVEQATHVLDVIRVLAGEVVQVAGVSAPSSADGRDVADATAAVLRLESGAVGTVSTSCVLPSLTAAGVEIVADRISALVTEDALRLRTPDGVQAWTPEIDARIAVDRAFVDVLLGTEPSVGLVDVGEALRTHRLAWAVAEATRSGAAVRVTAP